MCIRDSIVILILADEHILDLVADHHHLAAAQQLGDHKGADRRHEYHRDSRQNARHRQGKHDPAENLPAVGAQVLGLSLIHIYT